MLERKDTPIIVSGCLAGLRCNYKGETKPHPGVIKLVEEGKAIPLCPEQLGGLTTPRAPAERLGSKVVTKDGEDVTEQFERGAEEVAKIVEITGAKRVILKARSPSCGVGYTYDGSFCDRLIERDGVTAEKLRELDVVLLTEEDL